MSEHVAVVAVPVALEELARIVLLLVAQELRELRVAGEKLPLDRVAVEGEVVAAAVAKAEVDQAPEGVAGADQAARAALDVDIEADAGVGAARPGQEGLLVLLDEADGGPHDVEL